MVESLAQLGGIAVLADERYPKKLPLFGGIERARFRRQVVPGETLELEVTVGRLRPGPAPATAGPTWTARPPARPTCSSSWSTGRPDRPVRLATWNVNSLGVRLPLVIEWMEANQPDVLCLQETKQSDAAFPEAAFSDLGYRVRAPRAGTVERGGRRQPGRARRPVVRPAVRRGGRPGGTGAGRHLRRRAGALGLRAQRTDRGQRALRRQAGVAGPPARVPVRDLPARGPGGGLRGLQRRPDRRRRCGPRRLRRGSTHVTGPERAALASAHRLGLGRRLPAAYTRRRRRFSAGGTTAAATSTRARGCASTCGAGDAGLAGRCSSGEYRPRGPQEEPGGDKPSDHTAVVVTSNRPERAAAGPTAGHASGPAPPRQRRDHRSIRDGPGSSASVELVEPAPRRWWPGWPARPCPGPGATKSRSGRARSSMARRPGPGRPAPDPVRAPCSRWRRSGWPGSRWSRRGPRGPGSTGPGGCTWRCRRPPGTAPAGPGTATAAPVAAGRPWPMAPPVRVSQSWRRGPGGGAGDEDARGVGLVDHDGVLGQQGPDGGGQASRHGERRPVGRSGRAGPGGDGGAAGRAPSASARASRAPGTSSPGPRQDVDLAALGHQVARACPGRRRTTPGRPAPGQHQVAQPGQLGLGELGQVAQPLERGQPGAPRSRRAGKVSHEQLAPVAAATPAGGHQAPPPQRRSADEQAGRLARAQRLGGHRLDDRRRPGRRRRRPGGRAAAGPGHSDHETSAGSTRVATRPGGPVGGGHGLGRVGRPGRRPRPRRYQPETGPARRVDVGLERRRRGACGRWRGRRRRSPPGCGPGGRCAGWRGRCPAPGPRCRRVAAGRPATRP